MNRFLILGLFALLIVLVSLLRLLSEREFFRLTSMKKVWGRRRGLAMYFLGSVCLPLVLGVVFLSYGVVGFTPRQPGEYANDTYRRFDLKSVSQTMTLSVRRVVHEYWGSETGLCP